MSVKGQVLTSFRMKGNYKGEDSDSGSRRKRNRSNKDTLKVNVDGAAFSRLVGTDCS